MSLFDSEEFEVCPKCGGIGYVYDEKVDATRPCSCQRPDPAREMVGRYHSTGGDTEREAAARVAPKSGTQRAAVLQHLRGVGDLGSTDYETWVALGHICVRPHVPGTRREELIRDGWPIADSGIRRLTDTGNKAIVWVYRD
jgi:hypothetical protein